jgi:hypothetical protein
MAKSTDETTTSSSATEAFARHAQEDEALQSADDDAAASTVATTESQGLTSMGRIIVFLCFPLTIGVLGLYLGYLESIKKPDRKISFDQDFVMPFLLALAMAAVLFFQTAGFSTKKVQPLVRWPKARRVKKVVKKKKSEVAEDKVDYQSSSKKDD